MSRSGAARTTGALPTLSVVIVNPGPVGQGLIGSVASLADLCKHAGAELIVATSSQADASVLHAVAPACRIATSPLSPSTASLRVQGAAAANGDVVLFIDEIGSEQELRVLDRLEARRISVVGRLPRSKADVRIRSDGVTLSVIVPAHDAAHVLPQTLAAVRASAHPVAQWELIVVDDASRDGTAAIASRFADVLVRIPLRAHGPAYARNRGFEVSVGTWAVFLDADVQVRPDTLQRFAAAIADAPAVGAIVGSYDAASPARGIVAQYRNLMHHYAHRESAGDVDSFWAACGAVRSDVFAEAGMYDEWHYERPMIEGVELGQRIRALGYRIVVIPQIQGTHLKSWSLLSAIICDLRDHAVPWMRLLMRQRTLHEDRISLRAIERINRIGTWIALLALGIGSVVGDSRWAFTMGIVLLPVIFANRRLYAFFERERGVLFTLAAIPLHLLYYVLLGVAVLVAGVLQVVVGDPRPSPIIQAYAEIEIETWPPVPNRRTAMSRLRASAARA